MSHAGVSGYLIVAGSYSLIRAMDSSAVHNVGGVAPYLWILAVYGAMCVSGVFLLARPQVGARIGIIAMACQAPMIALGRLSYAIAAPPSIEFKLWPRVGLAFDTGYVFAVYLTEARVAFYLGVNIASVILGIWLVAFLRRLSREQRLQMITAGKNSAIDGLDPKA